MWSDNLRCLCSLFGIQQVELLWLAVGTEEFNFSTTRSVVVTIISLLIVSPVCLYLAKNLLIFTLI